MTHNQRQHENAPAPEAGRGRRRNVFTSRKTQYAIFGGILSLIVYLTFGLPAYRLPTLLVAWLMLQVAFASWLRWLPKTPIPVLPVVLSLYALYFSLPVFYVDEARFLNQVFTISDQTGMEVLSLALLTQLCIWLGCEIGFHRRTSWSLRFTLSERRMNTLAVVIIIVQGFIIYFSQVQNVVDLGNYRQIVNGVANLYLAFGLLFFSGERYGWKFLNVAGIVFIMLFYTAVSISSTMLGDLLMPFIVLGILVFRKYKALTISIGIAMVFVVIALQPVRSDYRNALQQSARAGVALSWSEKAALYANIALARWSGERMDLFYEESAEMQTGRRLSLLPILGIILRDTPDRIPFQYGKTFAFLLFTPVPRFLYEDKPTAQEANLWFAQTYGILDSYIAKTTMVGISHLGEVYVNFGVLGVPVIFLIFGFLLAVITRSGDREENAMIRNAVIVALSPNIFNIESTLTGFLVGIVYTTLFTYVAIWLFTRSVQSRLLRGRTVR
jgi:hypothetical protein